ncbi:MAG: lipase family protein [Oscillospiraceae bacterium]
MNDWELVESVTMRPAHTAGAFGLFSANVFKNDKQVVLAFRGTSEWQEWIGDLLFPVGNPEANCAVSFGTQMAAKYRDCKIYVTGHSLGGYLAQVGAAAAAYAEKPVERVVNFNGLGMPPPLIGQKYRNYIQNSGIGAVYACYRIQHDPVSVIGKQLQTPVTLALAPALQASGAAVPKKVKEVFNAKASTTSPPSSTISIRAGGRARTTSPMYTPIPKQYAHIKAIPADDHAGWKQRNPRS